MLSQPAWRLQDWQSAFAAAPGQPRLLQLCTLAPRVVLALHPLHGNDLACMVGQQSA